MRNNICLLFLFIILSFSLSACDHTKNEQSLAAYIAELKAKIQSEQQKKPMPKIKEPVAVKYQASSQRSPFAETVTPAKPKKMLHPLNAFPLNVLRFTGTITHNGKIEAVIIAPDHKVYEMAIGDSIGNHNGEIHKIEKDHIEIMEPADENEKESGKRIVTLRLKDES